jgi:hypothetical protein
VKAALKAQQEQQIDKVRCVCIIQMFVKWVHFISGLGNISYFEQFDVHGLDMQALIAEGRFYSDMELTEQEIERMVMEASRAEFLAGESFRLQSPWQEETSTSAGAEPSSSGTSKNFTLSL